MKKIENRTYQEDILNMIGFPECDFCPLYESPVCDNALPVDESICRKRVLKDMNSEFVEPHQYEPWELETMRHLSTIYKYMKVNSDGNINLRTTLTASKQRCTGMRLDSIHDTDWLDIDAELKAYGMSRD